MPSSRWQYTAWLANASFSSNRSMSVDLEARLREQLLHRGHRADAHDLRIDADGDERAEDAERLDAELVGLVARVITSAAAAPSEIGELLPAVTLPPCANAGGSLARPSSVVSARGSSSTVKSL